MHGGSYYDTSSLCWISPSTYEGPGRSDSGQEFNISILFHDGAAKQFDTVRIIIFCASSTTTENLFVTRRVSAEYSDIAFVFQRKYFDPSSPGQSPQSTSSELSLVLELREGVDHTREWCNPVRARLDLSRMESLSSSCQILLDHVEPLDGVSSVTLPLMSSSSFFPHANYEYPTMSGLRMTAGIFVYDIHVVPSHIHSRRKFRDLPPELMEKIFDFVFSLELDRYFNDYELTFLSLPLVCRSWRMAQEWLIRDPKRTACFLSLKGRLFAVDPERLARSLENSVIGQLTRSLSMHSFLQPPRNADARLKYENAVTRVLRKTPNLKILRIGETHHGMRKELLNQICQLEALERFILEQDHFNTNHEHGILLPNSYRKEWMYNLMLSEVAHCMRFWPYLRELRLYVVRKSDCDWWSAARRNDDALPTLKCHLETLVLHDGYISGPELHELTRHSFTTLRHVELSTTWGLTNMELLSWLEIVGPVLETFCLRSSSRGLERGLEDISPHAFDVVFPKMTKVRKLTLSGNVASELVLQRARGEWQIDSTDTQLSFSDIPGISYAVLVDALSVTGWRIINALLMERLTHVQEEDARRAAAEREICLYFAYTVGTLFD